MVTEKEIHKAMYELTAFLKPKDWRTLWNKTGAMQGIGEAIAIESKKEKKPLPLVAKKYYKFYFLPKRKLKKVI
jgi:hypothetical protein